MWYVVASLPVEGASSISTLPRRLAVCFSAHASSHPSVCLHHSCPVPESVPRSIYLKMVVAIMEKLSCGGLRSEGDTGVLWQGRGS